MVVSSLHCSSSHPTVKLLKFTSQSSDSSKKSANWRNVERLVPRFSFSNVERKMLRRHPPSLHPAAILSALVWEFVQLVLHTSSWQKCFLVRCPTTVAWLVKNLKGAWFMQESRNVALPTMMISWEFCTWVSCEVWNVLASTNIALLLAASSKWTIFSVLAVYVTNNTCLIYEAL